MNIDLGHYLMYPGFKRGSVVGFVAARSASGLMLFGTCVLSVHRVREPLEPRSKSKTKCHSVPKISNEY